MFPTIGDAWRSIHPEEVTRSRPAETVEMVVGAEQSRLAHQRHSSLLGNLSRYCRDNVLSSINAACRDLRASLGMVAMLEDQELSSALDIDHHSLPAFHPQNRRHRSDRGRRIEKRWTALGTGALAQRLATLEGPSRPGPP
jgi:hypothetical protein